LLDAAGADSIVQTAQGTGSHTILVEALTTANLVDTLNGAGPFTVFAPTDTAFEAALSALSLTKAQLLARADLKDILKYHVLSGNVSSSNLLATQSVPTLASSAKVTITKNAGDVMFAEAKVTSADVKCDNGVIHVIDKVILPPSNAKDVVVNAQLTGNHGILVEALTAAGLVSTLQGAGPFTVFAPTDTAFTAALSELSLTKEALLARPDLADILKYHVLSGRVMSADLSATQSPATLAVPATVTITSGNAVMFASASVTSADVNCSNGVIHVIDKVVLPPTLAKDIVVNAQLTGNHGILVEALTAAGLVSTLQGAGPFTVFAPTDAAFNLTLQDLSITKAQLLARKDLGNILKYHVLTGKTMAAALTATQSVATLADGAAKVTITKDANAVMFDSASVTTPDVEASNGVIHVIDTVVLPPSNPNETSSGTLDLKSGCAILFSLFFTFACTA
jgi:transforming growth factor-beta-induced protein